MFKLKITKKVLFALSFLCIASLFSCGLFDTGSGYSGGFNGAGSRNNSDGSPSVLCSGVTCATGESCNASTGACVPASNNLCQNITCVPTQTCDSLTGQCAYPLTVNGDGSCTAGQTIATAFSALGFIVIGGGGQPQGLIPGVTWSSSVAGTINSSTGVVTCPSATGHFTVTAHKNGYVDGTKIVSVNSVALVLQRITQAVDANTDCIGGGNGNHGTPTVTFKAFYGSTDVTNSATWTGSGILTADAVTKGRIICEPTNNQSQIQTGTFTVTYNGASTSKLLIVEDCGAGPDLQGGCS